MSTGMDTQDGMTQDLETGKGDWKEKEAQAQYSLRIFF